MTVIPCAYLSCEWQLLFCLTKLNARNSHESSKDLENFRQFSANASTGNRLVGRKKRKNTKKFKLNFDTSRLSPGSRSKALRQGLLH